MLRRVAPALVCLLGACHSPGPYGYSRTYSALDEEDTAAESAREFDPVMAERAPDEWSHKKISVFGVVHARKDAPNGGAYLTLGLRTLSDRNLCDEADESTCRVTVSAREHAVVHAVVKLAGEDDIGKNSVGVGSLVRVIGRLRDEVDREDGGAVLSAVYYRHWPRNEYVTTADSDHMRR